MYYLIYGFLYLVSLLPFFIFMHKVRERFLLVVILALAELLAPDDASPAAAAAA